MSEGIFTAQRLLSGKEPTYKLALFKVIISLQLRRQHPKTVKYQRFPALQLCPITRGMGKGVRRSLFEGSFCKIYEAFFVILH
jgi:hypothetical protein